MAHSSKNGKAGKITLYTVLGVLLLSIIIFGSDGFTSLLNGFSANKIAAVDPALASRQDSINNAAQNSEKYKQEFMKAATSEDDTNVVVIHVSSAEDVNVPYKIDNYAGKQVKRVFNGRRINIAITGLDSRLGTVSNHADANHVLSILIDSGYVEMTSVPRDTPADAGMEDSTGQNKLTVVRAGRGRAAYHKELARIAGLDKIHYYIELGFSQAIGILDRLGYRDPKSMLQVLRSRTALGGDDYQRCYNQGQFIRQMLLKHFSLLTGDLSDILIYGGMSIVETNLDYGTIKTILAALQAKGFPHNADDIPIKVRPPVPINYKIYDFTNQSVVDNLEKKIEYKNSRQSDDSIKTMVNVASRLRGVLSRARADSVKNPARVISALKVYFEQRAWLQVTDSTQRNQLRDQMGSLLYWSYLKKKQPAEANRVKSVMDSERKLFEKQYLKNN